MSHEALKSLFRRHGLRPSAERMAFGRLLAGGGRRRTTAYDIQVEVRAAGSSISLATIYGCIHAFLNVGLLSAISIEGKRLAYDVVERDDLQPCSGGGAAPSDAPPEVVEGDGRFRVSSGVEVPGAMTKGSDGHAASESAGGGPDAELRGTQLRDG